MKEVFVIKKLAGPLSSFYLTIHNDLTTFLTDAKWLDSYDKAKDCLESRQDVGYYQIEKIFEQKN